LSNYFRLANKTRYIAFAVQLVVKEICPSGHVK